MTPSSIDISFISCIIWLTYMPLYRIQNGAENAKKTRTGQTSVLPTIQPRIQSLVHNPFGFKAEQT